MTPARRKNPPEATASAAPASGARADTRLASRCLAMGLFGPDQAGVYEQALAAAPGDERFAKALSQTLFLGLLRRHTVGCSDPDQVDAEGVQDAIDYLREEIKAHNESPDLFVAMGDLYLLRGNALRAIGAYENAFKLGCTDHLGVVRSYEFASRMQKFHPSERAYFANLCLRAGLAGRALDLYRAIVADGFHDTSVVGSLAALLEKEAAGESNPNALNSLYMEIAELRMMAGDTPGALEGFRRVSFPIHSNFALVKRIAAILIDMQDYRQAFDYLSQIHVDEDNKQLINRITVELEKSGDLETATYLLRFINDNDLMFKEAQALRDKEIEIHTEFALAERNVSTRRYDLAMGNYIKILKLGYKEDLPVLARIVEVLPLLRSDHLQDLHFIGQFYLDKDDNYRAQQFYDLILEKRPDDRVAREKLRQVYGAIFERNPNLPELRLRSGDLFEQEGEPEAAIAEYRLAAQHPETHPEAMRRLAVLYVKTNRYTRAMESFQQIVITEIDLENLYQLHLIFRTQDRLGDALAMLRMVAEVDAGYRDVGERLRELGQEFASKTESRVADEKMRELIGDLAVGRYQYIEKIGSGGMGVVHKVYDQRLQKVVAMKILR